jgi:hypothetical protein
MLRVHLIKMGISVQDYFSFGGTRDCTQSLALGASAILREPQPQSFYFCFSDKVSYFCLAIPSFRVARTTGMGHHAWLDFEVRSH